MRASTRIAMIALAGGLSGCAFLLKSPHEQLVGACSDSAEHSVDAMLCTALGGTMPKQPVAPFVEALDLMVSSGEKKLPYAYDLALDVDPDAIDVAMTAAHVDASIAREFSAQLRSRRAETIAAVDVQSPHWRDIFVKPAIHARAQWRKGEARRAPWLAKATALMKHAGPASPSSIDQMLALRRAYVDDCTRAGEDIEQCLGDAVVRPLTYQIIVEAGRVGNPELQNAEVRLLDVPDRMTLGEAVRRAAEGAALDENGQYQLMNMEREGQVPPSGKKFPPDLIHTDGYTLAGHAPWNVHEHAEYEPREITTVQVARVERHGDRAKLTVRRYLQKYVTRTGCHESKDIDHVDLTNGRVIYQEQCSGPTEVEHKDETPEPVDVAWDEASHLRPGEIVSCVLLEKTRRGYIVSVRADDGRESHGEHLDEHRADDKVQVRSFRLDAAKAIAKNARRPTQSALR